MTLLLLLGAVTTAHTVETVTGFGATVIALSIGAHLVPIDALVAALVQVGWLQSVWIVSRGRREIRWDVLVRRILPFVAAGFPLGIWCSSVLSSGPLKVLLGAFVVGVSVLELARLLRPGAASKPFPRPLGFALLGAGGFFHGLFASGGPLIVYYASRVLPEKKGFRATLSTLWLCLGTTLIVTFVVSGRIDGAAVRLAASLLPALAGGILLGELLHEKVNEALFRKVVQVVLLLIGFTLLV